MPKAKIDYGKLRRQLFRDCRAQRKGRRDRSSLVINCLTRVIGEACWPIVFLSRRILPGSHVISERPPRVHWPIVLGQSLFLLVLLTRSPTSMVFENATITGPCVADLAAYYPPHE